MMVDLAIVGAGPAGMAAAALAAKLGLDTLLIDEQEGPGGQIYRAIERADTTGLSPLGWKGTWASWPQLEHVALNISRVPRPPPPPEE